MGLVMFCVFIGVSCYLCYVCGYKDGKSDVELDRRFEAEE